MKKNMKREKTKPSMTSDEVIETGSNGRNDIVRVPVAFMANNDESAHEEAAVIVVDRD